MKLITLIAAVLATSASFALDCKGSLGSQDVQLTKHVLSVPAGGPGYSFEGQIGKFIFSATIYGKDQNQINMWMAKDSTLSPRWQATAAFDYMGHAQMQTVDHQTADVINAVLTCKK
jgi:hypothetical protein